MTLPLEQREIILIRSHKIARPENDLYEALRNAFPKEAIVFCLDESRGAVDVGERRKISLTTEVAERLANQMLPKDWGWRMGDLCFQLAAECFPDTDRFWLIEGDVYVPRGNAAALFERLRGIEGSLAVCELTKRGKHRFNRGLEGVAEETQWGSMFAFVRADRPVIDAASALRRNIGAIYASRQSNPQVPNDEAIFVNAAVSGGFVIADFMRLQPDILSPEWFNRNPPFLYEHVSETEAHGQRIMTPVIEFEHLMTRISKPGVKEGRAHSYPRRRLRRILPVLSENQRVRLDAALAGTGSTGNAQPSDST